MAEELGGRADHDALPVESVAIQANAVLEENGRQVQEVCLDRVRDFTGSGRVDSPHRRRCTKDTASKEQDESERKPTDDSRKSKGRHRSLPLSGQVNHVPKWSSVGGGTIQNAT